MNERLAHLDPISLACWELTCQLMLTDEPTERHQLKMERAALIMSLSEPPVIPNRRDNENSSTRHNLLTIPFNR